MPRRKRDWKKISAIEPHQLLGAIRTQGNNPINYYPWLYRPDFEFYGRKNFASHLPTYVIIYNFNQDLLLDSTFSNLHLWEFLFDIILGAILAYVLSVPLEYWMSFRMLRIFLDYPMTCSTITNIEYNDFNLAYS